MRWDDLASQPCSISRALTVIGDRWTLLILRDCFAGVSRFEQLGQRLGIARNVLSDRLRTLVEGGILERRPYHVNPPRYDYHLTAKGRDLHPVLLAISHFGDSYYAGDEGAPLLRRHKRCGCDFHPIQVCSECLAPVVAEQVETRAGPGFRTPETAPAGKARTARRPPLKLAV